MMTDTHTHINQQDENNTHYFNPTVTSFNTEEKNEIENLRPCWNGITLAAMAVSCLPLNISLVYTPGKNIQYGALRIHYKIKSSRQHLKQETDHTNLQASVQILN